MSDLHKTEHPTGEPVVDASDEPSIEADVAAIEAVATELAAVEAELAAMDETRDAVSPEAEPLRAEPPSAE